MAGTIPTLARGTFTIDDGLKAKPVYFLTVNGQALVVKGEAPGMAMHQGTSQDDMAISIKWSSKFMKNVNNTLVNTKMLAPAEVTLFKEAVLAKFSKGTDQRDFVEKPRVAYQWVKMPMVRGLSDANYFKQGIGAKTIPGKVKNAIERFSEEPIWRALGKIIAVDVFDGNNDRFDPETGDLLNPGNVLFLEGGNTRLIGLDTYDPNNKWSNMNANAPDNVLQPLRVLNDGVLRLNYAKKCTLSLGEKLARALPPGTNEVMLRVHTPTEWVMHKYTPEQIKTMFKEFDKSLALGIEEGANGLKAYLQEKVRKYRLERSNPVPQVNTRTRSINPSLQRVLKEKPRDFPQGVWSRMVFLGWDV